MPMSKSAPIIGTLLFVIACLLGLEACSGFLVTPGTGVAGASGSAGTTGASGTIGSAGTIGASGTTGAAGTAGTSVAGTTGVSGTTGVAGTTGAAATGGTGGAPAGSAGTGAAGTNVSGSGGTSAGGRGGSGGASGTGGTTPPRGPTPAANGVNYPFPQNRAMAGCGYPANYLNADVQAAFNQWKAETVTADGAGSGGLRVQRLASDTQSASTPLNSTVSEGIAYGMIIAVYMGDKALFDGLWAYEKGHRNANGLMNWAVSSSGSVTGMGAATDADEDMAFALIMADKQWGGYMNDALNQVKAVWNNEIWESKLPRNGDGWGDWGNLNISYFAPAYYRIFKQIDTDTTHKWDDVINTAYDTITASLKAGNGNTTNGLVPAWCTSTGDKVAPGPGGAQPFHYQYDACRTPFRIGLDWCWFGETRARDYVAKTSGFFSGIGAANMVDGYDLNGAKHVEFSVASGIPTLAQQSAAFVGPAAVGAMSSPTYQTFINESYGRLATRQMLVGGSYYDQSWGVMSLLMMTGNYLNYRAITPFTGP